MKSGAGTPTLSGSDPATSLPAPVSRVDWCIRLALALALFHAYQFESESFVRSLILFSLGATPSWWLAAKWRPIALLTAGTLGLFFVLSPRVSLSVLLVTVAIAGLLSSRLRTSWKCVLLGIPAGTALLARTMVQLPPDLSIIISSLASVFMFRLLIALREDFNGNRLSFKNTLCYFLILPNYVASLFPVIDVKFMSSEVTDAVAVQCITRGLNWMLLGGLQLVLYRGVKHLLLVPLDAAQNVGDFFCYAVCNYLLYLRVSGLFHTLAGAICLYGYNLPETHHDYLFADSFGDYWRRINIYWKDFMLKSVYYPTYFYFRNVGTRPALVIATICVFFSTWFLHSYQVLWLLGDFPLRSGDYIFWGTLGLLVIFNTLRDEKYKKVRSLSHRGEETSFFRHAFRICTTLFVVTLLWTIWTASVRHMLAAFLWIQWEGSRSLVWVLFFPLVGILGASFARGNDVPTRVLFHSRLTTGLFGILWALLLLGSRLEFFAPFWNPQYETAWDQVVQINGFYEGLGGLKSVTFVPGPRPAPEPTAAGGAVPVSDFRKFEYVPNSRSMYEGKELVINRWGMEDHDYPLRKAPGTTRVALLGSSFSMSRAVDAGHDWSQVAEDAMQRQGMKVEILNFATNGYPLMVYPYVMEKKVFPFEPDIVLVEAMSLSFIRMAIEITETLRAGKDYPYPELYSILGITDSRCLQARFCFKLPGFETLARIAEFTLAKLKSQAVQKKQRLVVVMLPIRDSSRLLDVEKSIFAICARLKIETLDLSKVLEGRKSDEISLSKYDFHYNDAAQHLVAAAFQNELRFFLPQDSFPTGHK